MTHRVRGEDDRAAEVARGLAAAGGDLAAGYLAHAGDLAGAEVLARARLDRLGATSPSAERRRALRGLSEVLARGGRLREALELALRAAALPGLTPVQQAKGNAWAAELAIGAPGGPDRARPKIEALLREPQPGSLPFAALVAAVAGQDALAERLAPLALECTRSLLRAYRRDDAAFPVAMDTDCVAPAAARELALGQLLLRSGRDREAVDHLRRFRSQAFDSSAWQAWALPRSRVLEAAALVRLGEREAARAQLASLDRELARADPDLPWVRELRSLQAQR